MACPTCEAPTPNLHPSIGCGGEAELCVDDFHFTDDRYPPSQDDLAWRARKLAARNKEQVR